MKAFAVAILSFSFTLAAFGQSVIDSGRPHQYALEEQTDSGFTNKAEASNVMEDGVREGKWVQYFKIKNNREVETKSKHATFYQLTIYKQGKPKGMMRSYTNDGKLDGQVFFVNGRQNGIGKALYPNGRIAVETPFVNGKIQGVRKIYNRHGEEMMTDTVTNGKESGCIKTYYPSGKVKYYLPFTNDTSNHHSKITFDTASIQCYEDKNFKRGGGGTTIFGIVNGAEKDYFENGNVEFEMPFVNGDLNGIQKSYYNNGILRSETSYKSGKLNGPDKYYDKDGHLESEIPFVDGKITGVVKHYYPDGKLKTEATFQQNEIVGTEKLYDESGVELK